MDISIVIIGRNCSEVLEACIFSVKAALIVAGDYINSYEILYVDSASFDRSIKIASDFEQVKTIEILDSTFFSASLGRRLGMTHALYSNLLFLDCDMTLSEDWFIKSRGFYERYGAVVGRWTERQLTSEGDLIREIDNYNAISSITPISRPCGFLQINRDCLPVEVIFHGLVINNEEKDFYAQFYSYRRIWAIPVSAFTHNNYNSGAKRKLQAYLSHKFKTGYLVSAYLSLKGGYFGGFARIQYDKILNLLFLLLIMIYWIFNEPLLILVSTIILIFPIRKLKSRLMDLFFLPLKVFTSAKIVSQAHFVEYRFNDKGYKLRFE